MASQTSGSTHNLFSAVDIRRPSNPDTASAPSIFSSNQPGTHDRASATSYDSDGDESESDGSVCDYNTDDDPELWTVNKVGLRDWYTCITNKKPIYTRERLQKCLEDRNRILSGNTCEKIIGPDFLTGKDRVLFTREDFEPRTLKPVVAVNFLTAAEMHPDSHQLPHGSRSNSIRPLHYMNGTTRKYEYIFAPISFDIYCQPRSYKITHEDTKVMNWWRNKIRAARNIWNKSPAKLHLESKFGWSSNTHINKLVCFGLGKLLQKDSKLDCGDLILQHFTVFDIAALLNKMRKEEDPNAFPVEVCLQDPTYIELDRILLREAFEVACPGLKLSFLQDPESYLKIDQYTIVVGPYLPYMVPFIQICADIGQPANNDNENTWPAGFIFDHIMKKDDQPNKKLWRGRTRISPRVMKMLEHYTEVNDFERKEGGQKLRDELEMDDESFWLSLMDIWMKK